MNRILTLVTVCALALPAQLLSQTTTVILVRHAEQDYASDDRDPILSAAGEARAEELVRVLREVKIDAIYSTPLHRTRDTAKPVAQLLGLEVTETPVQRPFGEYMADLIRERHAGETVLVVSHSNTVPAIINALGGGPLDDLNHDEYDDLFVVTLSAEGTTVTRLKYGIPTP